MQFKFRVMGAAFAAALVFAGAAAAQQTAPAPAGGGSTAPTSAHVEAAKEVVELSGISRTFNLFYPQLAESLVNTLSRTRPELRADLIASVKTLQAEFDKRHEEMVVSTARNFAAVMSEKALKETAAFFKSDAGKQYVMMQPQVIDQMMANLDVWNRRMSEDLMTRVREEMRKKGHSL